MPSLLRRYLRQVATSFISVVSGKRDSLFGSVFAVLEIHTL
jgi:hypothetical protein